MASGSFTGSCVGNNDTGKHYIIQVDWSSTPNIPANNSKITAKLSCRSTSATYSTQATWTPVIQGSTRPATNKKITTSWVELGSHEWTVNHAADGSCPITISASFTGNLNDTWALRSGSASKLVYLDVIPRTSTIADISGNTVGQNLVFRVTAAATFDHVLEYCFSGDSTWTQIGPVSTHSGAKDIALSLDSTISSKLRDHGSRNITIRQTTKSGATVIGSSSFTKLIYSQSLSLASAPASVALGANLNVKMSSGVGDNGMSYYARLAFGNTTTDWIGPISVSNSSGANIPVPESFGQQIPTTMSGAGTIVIHSYNGNAYVGEYSKSATITVPNYSYTTGGTCNVSVQGTYQGKIVESKSSFSISLSQASPKYGASWPSISLERNRSQVSGTNHMAIYGANNFRWKLVDSRGNIAYSDEKAYNALLYFAPRVVEYSAERWSQNVATRVSAPGGPDPYGTQIMLKFVFELADLDGTASAKMFIKHGENILHNVSSADITFANGIRRCSIAKLAPTSTEYPVSSSHTFSFIAGDQYGESAISLSYIVPTAQFPLHIHPDGVGVGKMREKGALDIQGDVYVNNSHIDSKYVQKFHLGSPGDYASMVIGLCKVGPNSSPLYSLSSGTIHANRENGLFQGYKIDFNASNRWSTDSIMNIGYTVINPSGDTNTVRPCTFTYGGVKYGGLYFYPGAASVSFLEFNGLTHNITPFMVTYENNSGVLNSEIKNSIDFTKVYHSSVNTSNSLVVQGGLNVSGTLNGFKMPNKATTTGESYHDAIVATKPDGVTEIGKYLDFHENATGSDYDGRLYVDPSKNLMYVKSGALRTVAMGELANGHFGLQNPLSPDSWIRTTSYGFLPYSTTSNTWIGHPDWKFAEGWFKKGYVDTLYVGGTEQGDYPNYVPVFSGDLNGITRTCIVYTSGATNQPANYCHVQTYARGSGEQTQVAYSSTATMWTRFKNLAGTWSAWTAK